MWNSFLLELFLESGVLEHIWTYSEKDRANTLRITGSDVSYATARNIYYTMLGRMLSLKVIAYSQSEHKSIVNKWWLLIWYFTAYLVIDFDEKTTQQNFQKEPQSCERLKEKFHDIFTDQENTNAVPMSSIELFTTPCILSTYLQYFLAMLIIGYIHSCSSWFHLCHHFRLDILSILGHVSLCLIASDKRECLLTIRTNKCNVSINCDRNVFIAISSLYWLLISLKGCQQILI